ncbi:hypothetical protein BHM03_00048530 [Ensete ventricosum]|nr:hypothetical protein BHM03_00048530 [Ensete ventricosum]
MQRSLSGERLRSHTGGSKLGLVGLPVSNPCFRKDRAISPGLHPAFWLERNSGHCRLFRYFKLRIAISQYTGLYWFLAGPVHTIPVMVYRHIVYRYVQSARKKRRPWRKRRKKNEEMEGRRRGSGGGKVRRRKRKALKRRRGRKRKQDEEAKEEEEEEEAKEAGGGGGGGRGRKKRQWWTKLILFGVFNLISWLMSLTNVMSCYFSLLELAAYILL